MVEKNIKYKFDKIYIHYNKYKWKFGEKIKKKLLIRFFLY